MQQNQVDELLLSFKYPTRKLASECNQKFENLVHSTLLPSLERSFKSIPSQGISLEIDYLAIDLGKISEKDIDEGLGERIYDLLREALKKEIAGRIGLSSQNPDNGAKLQNQLILLAMESFLMKGYFPSWMDSAWDLDSILDELFGNSPKDFSDLIGRLILGNESVRSRIAILNDDYFDKIVQLLIPEDAEWVLGYRETYLAVQKEKPELSSSEKQLKVALNLFIINYIALDSGPRFNRMSFSNNFLKSIAAHHNLDFELFLKEIIQLVEQVPIKTQWHQTFKETIEWVAEQNTDAEPFEELPDSAGLIEWFNYSSPTAIIPFWLSQWIDSGMVFNVLLKKYPGFWNQLNPNGQKKFFRIIAGEQGDLWERMTDHSLAFIQKESEGFKSSSKEITAKELFSFAAKLVESNSLMLLNKEDWYKILLAFALDYFNLESKAQLLKLKFLIDVGVDHGIPEAPLILGTLLREQSNSRQNQNKSNPIQQEILKEGGIKREQAFQEPILSRVEEEKHSKDAYDSETIAEQILWKYLSSGVLNGSFSEINKKDLILSLETVLQKKKPILIDWLKQGSSPSYPLLSKRIWSLLQELDSTYLINYLEKFGGNITQDVLTRSQKLRSIFQIKSNKPDLLDELLWKTFLVEFTPSSSGLISFLVSKLNFLEDALALIARMPTMPEDLQRSLLAKEAELQRKKSRLLNWSSDFSINMPEQMTDLLWLSLKNKGGVPVGFLNLRKVAKKHSSAFIFSIYSSKEIEAKDWSDLLSIKEEDFKDFLKSSSDVNYSNRQVLGIIEKDIRLIFDPQEQFSAWSQRRKLSSLKRLLILTQNQPQLLKESLDSHLPDLILRLPDLQGLMSESEWRAFSEFLMSNYSDMRNILVSISRVSPEVSNQSLGKLNKGLQKKELFNYSDLNKLLKENADLSSPSLEKKITRELIPALGLRKELKDELLGLFMLSDGYFSNRQYQTRWRKLLLAFISGILSKNGTLNDFWENLGQFLTRSPGYISFSSQLQEEIDRPISAQGLTLSNFGRDTFGKVLKETRNGKSEPQELGDKEQESLNSSLLFLKKEGYIPWWSPFKEAYSLLFNTLKGIEQASPELAEVMLLLFSKKGLSNLISGLNLNQIQLLIIWLSNSKYKNHYRDLLSSLKEFESLRGSKQGSNGKVDSNGAKQVSDETDGTSISNTTSIPRLDTDQKNSLESLQGNPENLDRLIKKAINRSDELDLIKRWFFEDPRIQQQLSEMISWSVWMYGSRLNPGLWKSLVLGFAYEFYKKNKKTFSRAFFEEFLAYLVKSHSVINWNSVFSKIAQKQEFKYEKYLAYQNVIKQKFPSTKVEKQDVPQVGDQVKIRNAGLILCWPFLSVLFSRLGILEEGVIPIKNQSRAVYILQNIAFGRYDFPEYEMALNKLLIGMKSSQHLEEVELSEEEINLSESLIRGMQSNWEKMKKASVEAVRETFLQREGILEYGEEGVKLSVARTGVDVLLDSVSWNIGMIRLPWMEKSLEVKWR